MKIFKKTISFIIAIYLSTLGIMSVSAKSIYEYYSDGAYSNSSINQTNLCFYVQSSASSLFSSSVFQGAFDWNSISSNVSVNAVAIYPAPYAQYSSYSQVYGSSSLGTALGQTYYYSSNGVETSASSTSIYTTSIYMNSNTNVYNYNGSITTSAKKTFTHEAGHVLLLSHPVNSTFPSIMHQGIPKTGTVISSTITSNDQNALRYKWGN